MTTRIKPKRAPKGLQHTHFSVDEAMEMLGKSQATLGRYRRDGILDSVKLGRERFYSKASVYRLLENLKG